MIFSQAGLESPPGTKSVPWKRKSFEKRGRAVALLRRRHPILKKAEGDWAATWLFRHRSKSHNRTWKERRKKEKDPKGWAGTVAARKIKRFKKLNEELEGGDLEAIEAANLARARHQDARDPINDSSQSSRAASPIGSDPEDEEEPSYERFYDIPDDQQLQVTRVRSSRQDLRSNRTLSYQAADIEDADEVGSQHSYSTLHFGSFTHTAQPHLVGDHGRTPTNARRDGVRYRGPTETQHEMIASMTRLLGKGTGVPNPYADDPDEEDLGQNYSGNARSRLRTRGSSEGYTPPPKPKQIQAPNEKEVPANPLAKVAPQVVNGPKSVNHAPAQGPKPIKGHQHHQITTPQGHADLNSSYAAAKQPMRVGHLPERTVASVASKDELPPPQLVLEKMRTDQREKSTSPGVNDEATIQPKTKRPRDKEHTPAQMEATKPRKKPKKLNNPIMEPRHNEHTPVQMEATEPNKKTSKNSNPSTEAPHKEHRPAQMQARVPQKQANKHLNDSTEVHHKGPRPSLMQASEPNKTPKPEEDSNINLNYPQYNASRIEGTNSMKAVKGKSSNVYLKSPVEVQGPSRSAGAPDTAPTPFRQGNFQSPMIRLNNVEQ
jgi:hypothetical protein